MFENEDGNGTPDVALPTRRLRHRFQLRPRLLRRPGR